MERHALKVKNRMNTLATIVLYAAIVLYVCLAIAIFRPAIDLDNSERINGGVHIH